MVKFAKLFGRATLAEKFSDAAAVMGNMVATVTFCSALPLGIVAVAIPFFIEICTTALVVGGGIIMEDMVDVEDVEEVEVEDVEEVEVDDIEVVEVAEEVVDSDEVEEVEFDVVVTEDVDVEFISMVVLCDAVSRNIRKVAEIEISMSNVRRKSNSRFCIFLIQIKKIKKGIEMQSYPTQNGLSPTSLKDLDAFPVAISYDVELTLKALSMSEKSLIWPLHLGCF